MFRDLKNVSILAQEKPQLGLRLSSFWSLEESSRLKGTFEALNFDYRRAAVESDSLIHDCLSESVLVDAHLWDTKALLQGKSQSN